MTQHTSHLLQCHPKRYNSGRSEVLGRSHLLSLLAIGLEEEGRD